MVTETILPNSKTNLFKNNEQDFFFWVDPKNHIIFNNICLVGVFSNPASTTSEDNLLFIPNPKYKGFISPYQNNIIKRIRAEYWLELYRPSKYPSRLHALYLCISEHDAEDYREVHTDHNAEDYREVHTDHTRDRELIKGRSVAGCLYSVHDSGWFDFLCKDASFDEVSIKDATHNYWSGVKVCESSVYLYGKQWSQKPAMEVLFYGSLKISEDDKEKISRIFRKAYNENPSNYPKMNL